MVSDLRKLILYEQRKRGQKDRSPTSSAASTSSQSPEVVNMSRKSHKTTCSRHRHKSSRFL